MQLITWTLDGGKLTFIIYPLMHLKKKYQYLIVFMEGVEVIDFYRQVCNYSFLFLPLTCRFTTYTFKM